MLNVYVDKFDKILKGDQTGTSESVLNLTLPKIIHPNRSILVPTCSYFEYGFESALNFNDTWKYDF